MGMVGQLIERPSELKGDPIPPQVKGICPPDPDDDDKDNKTAKRRSVVYEDKRKRSNHFGHKYKFIRGSAY
jgi:hypothetical protein